MTGGVRVEATGETVGEAKWVALRELEQLHPGVDKSAVRFEVLSEGERGLLGVGYAPARVVALIDEDALEASPPVEESELATDVRGLVERICGAIGVRCRVTVAEDEASLAVACTGADVGLLIGRHGQTIDAIQYLLNAIVHRTGSPKSVEIDAGGYRERRRVVVEALALRSAERALSTGAPVALEPMTPVERKLVHLRLQEHEGVTTRSEGSEPNRYVVVDPLRS